MCKTAACNNQLYLDNRDPLTGVSHICRRIDRSRAHTAGRRVPVGKVEQVGQGEEAADVLVLGAGLVVDGRTQACCAIIIIYKQRFIR